MDNKTSAQTESNINRSVEFPWLDTIHELGNLSKAIRESQVLLDITDESKNLGPMPPLYKVWRKSCEFLWQHAISLREWSHFIMQTPYIDPTPDGGLSFLWDNNDYRLLITIHPNLEITYYGDNTNWKNKVKGKTRIDEIDTKLISWFTLTYEQMGD